MGQVDLLALLYSGLEIAALPADVQAVDGDFIALVGGGSQHIHERDVGKEMLLGACILSKISFT